jgi:hypothetical protein
MSIDRQYHQPRMNAEPQIVTDRTNEPERHDSSKQEDSQRAVQCHISLANQSVNTVSCDRSETFTADTHVTRVRATRR